MGHNKVYSLKLTFLTNILVQIILFLRSSEALETFVVSFQSNGGWSTDQWMEHKEKLAGLEREFTVCHWEKLRYFSIGFNGVWSYCYRKSELASDPLCWQLYTNGDPEAAERNVWLNVTVTNFVGNYELKTSTHLLQYQHRQWNHFCWTYSANSKNSKLYYNGKLMKVDFEGKFTIFDNPDTLLDSAFIIGQEPDSLRGGFDLEQLFNGEISELNMWSKVLNDTEISSAARCIQVARGDVISWEIKNFIMNNVIVTALNEDKFFCKERKEFIIFPQKMPINGAKAICDVHGGSVAIPQSKNDETEIFDILEKHKRACLDHPLSNMVQVGKAVWLGMERIKHKWYVFDHRNQMQPINYTNWDKSTCTSEQCGHSDLSCPFMKKDGLWAFGLQSTHCRSLELCAICEITAMPVFTLKGLCSQDSQMDWNFYFMTNNARQIVGYDGYRTSKIHLIDNVWKAQDNGVTAETSSQYPIGRIQWNYTDRTCALQSTMQTYMTLSRCNFGKEFTCNSGECIKMSERCNKIYDCGDKSDEENCSLVHIPNSYNKIISPQPGGMEEKHGGKEESKTMITRVNIIHVDVIDTLQMLIGITIEIQIKWMDDRLTFENLNVEGKNPIPKETALILWLPLDNIIHDNAVLGQIIEDAHRDVGIEVLTPTVLTDITKNIENYIYTGTDNQLVMKQRFKIAYNCIFMLSHFPFDKHVCKFVMKLDRENNRTILFIQDEPAVYYDGSKTVNQFEVGNMTSEVINNLNTTTFIFSIDINRLHIDQMLCTFLPSTLLWCLAYFTLFIDLENFSDRFIGAVTALLVLVALLSSVTGDLPKTSYFKFIDLWFLWYILSILLIILFHIILNQISNNNIGIIVKVKPVNTTPEERNASPEVPSSMGNKARANKLAIAIFAITIVLFDLFYFIFSAH